MMEVQGESYFQVNDYSLCCATEYSYYNVIVFECDLLVY